MVSLANTGRREVPELITTYGVSVHDVLDVDCLVGTTVLAGHNGMDRAVTRVNGMEVPDVIDWVKPHELLVTTGYSIVSSVSDEAGRSATFVRLVRDPAGRGVAALGGTLGRCGA